MNWRPKMPTLKGVDISNWQAGITPSSLGVDFCIVKATEGVSFTDKQCDRYISNCKANGILWGFYHFARPDKNSAEAEADFFYNQTKGYTGQGIPVLDYEVWGKINAAEWCEKFLPRYHELTGIWAMIYISASNCSKFKGSWIAEKCGLWVAGYPKGYTSWPDSKIPYSIAPWSVCAIWQFTDKLKLSAWSGNLDGDYAYMDAAAWGKYAGGSGEAVKPAEPAAPAVPSFALGNYVTQVDALRVRTGPGTGYRQKVCSELTADGRKHSNAAGCLNKGTTVTVSKVQQVGSDVWGQIPSGWIALYYGGQYYAKKA